MVGGESKLEKSRRAGVQRGRAEAGGVSVSFPLIKVFIRFSKQSSIWLITTKKNWPTSDSVLWFLKGVSTPKMTICQPTSDVKGKNYSDTC